MDWNIFRMRYLFRFMYLVLLYIAKKDVKKDAEALAVRIKVIFREDFYE